MEKYYADKNFIVMTREQVRGVDSWAINQLGVGGVVLMENAGRSCAELVKEKLAAIANPSVSIFCGTGNNGGDGYVIARHLLNSGFNVSVMICGDRSKIKGDAKINLDILERMGQRIELLSLNSDIAGKIKTFAAGSDMIADCLFGTGLTGRLSGEYIELIESINGLQLPVLAVDIPSGLECDTGQPLGAAIEAACTVTFVAVKKGFTFPQAAAYTGDIFIASIGIEPPPNPKN